MPLCWKCRDTGAYLATKFYALMNEYRIVEKDCDCGAGKRDFPYEESASCAKIAERFRSTHATESPLTTIAVGGE